MERKDAIASVQDEALNVSEQQRLKLEQIESNYITAKDKLAKENERLAKLIESNYELIEDYSKFRNVHSIMIVLADITTLFMGHEYHYEMKKAEPILVPQDLNNYEIISFLDEFYHEGIQFYKYDGDVDNKLFQYTLYASDNLETYDFLKRFIDYVISYKFEVSRKNLSAEVLRRLEKEFVLANIDEIKKINEEANKIDKAKYEESVASRQKLLRRFVREETEKKK